MATDRPRQAGEVPGRPRKALASAALVALLLVSAALALLLRESDRQHLPLPSTLQPQTADGQRLRYLDRQGGPLSVTFATPLNLHDQLRLHDMPPLLPQAMVAAEDRRFYRHHGVDWLARGHAVLQNLLALRQVRGASTISEQVVRILHPRPRTLWSRWLEGLEAAELERRFTKNDILEFYLNQVPYERRRRGILQAAQLYFGRAPSTLRPAEILALAVLVRAPALLSRPQRGDELQRAVWRLATRLSSATADEVTKRRDLLVTLPPPAALHLPVAADHFLRYVQGQEMAGADAAVVRTTLDPALQARVQEHLQQHLDTLRRFDVHNGAALVVDHQRDEILCWVSAAHREAEHPSQWLDGVTSPRQPGSTLKPFLYALALDSGYTAATLLEDAPLSGQVGDGLHPFRNFSRRHYGPLRLRQALGNSLNVPAILAIRHTGVDNFLQRLHQAGMNSLHFPAEHYGEGLALGNGEVTLLELVGGYATLARGGLFRPLHASDNGPTNGRGRLAVFSPEAASLIADILADPQARRLEFGDGSILRFPVETAVKTGTSNDHRDTWALGFDSRYTAGVWMGNLDGRSTLGLTGAGGPALILRAIFAELQRQGEPRPLWRSPRLARHLICLESGAKAGAHCPRGEELFMPGTAPEGPCPLAHETGSATLATATRGKSQGNEPQLLQPTPHLLLAMDPHIPDHLEAYALRLSPDQGATHGEVEWLVDNRVVGISPPGEDSFLWHLSPGNHQAMARVHRGKDVLESAAVAFTVR
mgnify:CR=1 FL=1